MSKQKIVELCDACLDETSSETSGPNSTMLRNVRQLLFMEPLVVRQIYYWHRRHSSSSHFITGVLLQMATGVFLLAWVLIEPSLAHANDEVTVEGIINAFQSGFLELIKYLVVALAMLLMGKILSFFWHGLGDIFEELLIAIKEKPAILKGTGEMAYQLTAAIVEIDDKPVNHYTTPFPKLPTYKDGQPQAVKYELENVILMHWGKRARFKATLYGLIEGGQKWKAKITGSGTYVGDTYGTRGDFYLQCEGVTDRAFGSINSQPREVWAVTYVLRSFPSFQGYHFEGHWLLRSADNYNQARFGTLVLKSDTQPTIWKLFKMVLWD